MTRPSARRSCFAAAEAPLKQIAINAGLEGGVVAEKVRNLPAGEGLNAATGEYGDLVAAGIIDPAKVTRSALQNAASIAALFLTTEAVIADKPEKAAPAPAAATPVAWAAWTSESSPLRTPREAARAMRAASRVSTWRADVTQPPLSGRRAGSTQRLDRALGSRPARRCPACPWASRRSASRTADPPTE